MALGVPVADEDSVVVLRVGVGDWDEEAAVDAEAAEGTGGPVEAEAWVVEVAPYLVFHLELVGEVGTWWDGAVCSRNTVLPRVLPLLDPGPAMGKRNLL